MRKETTFNRDVKAGFATAVKWWRSQRGFSQEQLGERAGLHRTYISDVERGARNLSLASISKLAHALEISVSELFPSTANQTGVASLNQLGREIVEVVLIEDNPDDIELTLLAFQRARFSNRIHVLRDGAEALEFFFARSGAVSSPAHSHSQVVLLDLNLPKVNGLEVLRRLKADPQTQAIPVVVLTVSQRDRDIAECARLGALTYIVKPVDFHSLSRVTPQLQLNWALFKPAIASQP